MKTMLIRTFILILVLFSLVLFSNIVFSQCTLTNATSCICQNGSDTCDLLPDISISWDALFNYQSGPTEYSQSGNGANNGRLRLTGATPNTGFGPFAVFSSDTSGMKTIVCGTDTFYTSATVSFTCPNGAIPKQILRQRIYRKEGNTMTWYEHFTPPMTYSNSSMYVDEWGVFTLRIMMPGLLDPRNWPIVGSGSKRAFCLMDYGTCTFYNGMCRDDNTIYQQGTVLLNGDFPNWGLGNSYGCSPSEQGISSGYTDIYSENLDGMWISIPPETCNGDYWIVYEVDPHDYFKEENENNNWTAIPITLTQQNTPGNPEVKIYSNAMPTVCGNDSVELFATAGFSFAWSTGATTQKIMAGPGYYQVTVSNHCGTAVSDSLQVVQIIPPADPVGVNDTVCIGSTATLSAIGSNLFWYDSNMQQVGSGNLFTTPPIFNNQDYFVQEEQVTNGILNTVGKADSSGGGGYFSGSQYLIFDAYQPFLLKSVKVYAQNAGMRLITLISFAGTTLSTAVVNLPAGESTVSLNFNVPKANDLQLSHNSGANLWRNNSGVNYPYTISDTVSIKTSSAGDGFYYSFYDWEIETGRFSCVSNPVMISAIAELCSGIDYIVLGQQFTIFPNPSEGDLLIHWTGYPFNDRALVTLHDLAGRLILNKEIMVYEGEGLYEFNSIDVESGVYYLQLNVNDRFIVNRKIIFSPR